MTLIRNIFSEKSIFKKKFIVYVAAISGIVTLLVTALLIVFFTTSAFKSHDDLDHWSYKDQDKWPMTCTTSQMQSPIALTQRFAYKKKITPIVLENFGKCKCLNVKNNGHTVMVTFLKACNCQKPKISGGLLNQNYTMESFHFHWPSEHTIDGLRYDLEAHFVFYADKYGNFEEALKHPHGLTVLAILFTETMSTSSNNFRTIADAVKSVSSKPGCSCRTAKSINFHQFLPYDHQVYFMYNGSLTTPKCSEYVNWIVYRNHSNIAMLDLKDLTHIYDDHHELLKENFRSLQDLNNRTIYMQEVPS